MWSYKLRRTLNLYDLSSAPETNTGAYGKVLT